MDRKKKISGQSLLGVLVAVSLLGLASYQVSTMLVTSIRGQRMVATSHSFDSYWMGVQALLQDVATCNQNFIDRTLQLDQSGYQAGTSYDANSFKISYIGLNGLTGKTIASSGDRIGDLVAEVPKLKLESFSDVQAQATLTLTAIRPVGVSALGASTKEKSIPLQFSIVKTSANQAKIKSCIVNGATGLGTTSPSGAWTPTAPSQRLVGCTNKGALLVGELIFCYVGAGPDAITINDAAGAQLYNPKTDEWIVSSVPSYALARPFVGAGQGMDPTAFYHNYSVVWTGSKVLMIGRSTGGGAVSGAFDPTAKTWSAIATAGAPLAVMESSAVWTGTEMIVWGGATYNTSTWAFGIQNTGFRYNPSLNQWKSVSTAGAPSARYHHQAVWTGTKMIVWGGFASKDAASSLNTGAIYDPVTNTWTTMSTTGAPASGPAVWTGSKMMVFGREGRAGYCLEFSSSFPTENGGIYDPTTNTWSSISMTGAPSPRYCHAVSMAGQKVIVWGGTNRISYQNGAGTPILYVGENFRDGGLYDPATNIWAPITSIFAPASRNSNDATYLNGKVYVLGGSGRRYGAINDYGYVGSGGAIKIE